LPWQTTNKKDELGNVGHAQCLVDADVAGNLTAALAVASSGADCMNAHSWRQYAQGKFSFAHLLRRSILMRCYVIQHATTVRHALANTKNVMSITL
jgi:hypothetical protein